MKKNRMTSALLAVMLGMMTTLSVPAVSGTEVWAAQTEDTLQKEGAAQTEDAAQNEDTSQPEDAVQTEDADADSGHGYEVHEEEAPEPEEDPQEELTEEAQEAREAQEQAAAEASKALSDKLETDAYDDMVYLTKDKDLEKLLSYCFSDC